MKERILAEADRLFSQFGIKSITMEDLSRNLGISKKTLYQYFENKDDLVRQWTLNVMELIDKQREFCMKNSENAIDEVFQILSTCLESIIKLNPLIIHDLIKYHPACVAEIQAQNHSKESEREEDLIKRGIAEGLFRKEIDRKVLTKIQLSLKDQCLNSEVFPPLEYNVFRVMKEVSITFLYGMSTLEGHKLIDHYRSEVEAGLQAQAD